MNAEPGWCIGFTFAPGTRRYPGCPPRAPVLERLITFQ